MSYETIIRETIDRLPEFAEAYNYAFKKDDIDAESGPHTVFSFVFVPLLEDAMTKDKNLAKRMFDFLEEMECSGDSNVAEVVEFTVLEELCDRYRDEEFDEFLGQETRLSREAIRGYILGPL